VNEAIPSLFHCFTVNRGGGGVPFSERKTDLTYLFCGRSIFEGVIKSLKNWLKMAKKQLGFERKPG
jgi:hypothetical protein